MFIGHWAIGLGAKRLAPQLSLGTLLLAAQWVDLIWPTLLLLGVESVRIAPELIGVMPLDFVDYPLSHSLVAGVGWGILLGAAVWRLRRSRRAAFVVAGAVVSHWFLDLVMHRPDLPLLTTAGRRFGLGLWTSLPGTIAVELALLAACVWIYARVTRPRSRAGTVGFIGLISFVLLIYAFNLFGPPPPSVRAIGWTGQAQWLLVAWGYWLDRHRTLAKGVE
jgi:membrane-bound metal-dependent hydrolase YbcI (DUF457 family)